MTRTNETSLNEAIQDIKSRKFASIRAAARFHVCSPSTLSRRLQGGLSIAQKHREQQKLSEDQEDLLKSWILQSEATGHPVSHPYVRKLAGHISEQAGGPPNVGNNWVSRYIQRHPDIKSKVGKKIDVLRVQNTTPEALTKWFGMLKNVQDTYNVKSANTWNMDETGTALGVCTNQYVIGTASTRSSYIKSPENREWVSSIETISATGRSIKPVIIFKGQGLQSTWFKAQDCPDWLFAVSENGWTSNTIGLRWLNDVFIPQTACGDETRILLLDGHGSHASDEFMLKCIENNIKPVYLIPHSSHVLQPLDLACFSLVKSQYRREIANLSRFKDSAHVNKIRFIQYYDKARQRGLSPSQIKSGWKAAGIVPWDPAKVIKSSQIPQQTPQQTPQDAPLTPGRFRQRSNERLYNTPKNRHYLERLARQLSPLIGTDRALRAVLRKTSKAFDQLNYQDTIRNEQLKAYQLQLQEQKTKKQKKVVIDSNEAFATLDTIIATKTRVALQQPLWDRQKKAAAARETANVMIASRMTAFMHQFHVHDVVEVDN